MENNTSCQAGMNKFLVVSETKLVFLDSIQENVGDK
jgi:hypothetical protein